MEHLSAAEPSRPSAQSPQSPVKVAGHHHGRRKICVFVRSCPASSSQKRRRGYWNPVVG
jgi:hypothetical protein